MALLSEPDFDIKHIKGKENKIGHTLRRHAHNLMEVVVSNTNKYLSENIRNSVNNDQKYLEI